MAGGWGLKWIETATQTIKSVERSIDQAIGIPSDQAAPPPDDITQGRAVPSLAATTRSAPVGSPPSAGIGGGGTPAGGGGAGRAPSPGRPPPARQPGGTTPTSTMSPPSSRGASPSRPGAAGNRSKSGQGSVEDVPLEDLLNGDLLSSASSSPQRKTKPAPKTTRPAASNAKPSSNSDGGTATQSVQSSPVQPSESAPSDNSAAPLSNSNSNDTNETKANEVNPHSTHAEASGSSLNTVEPQPELQILRAEPTNQQLLKEEKENHETNSEEDLDREIESRITASSAQVITEESSNGVSEKFETYSSDEDLKSPKAIDVPSNNSEQTESKANTEQSEDTVSSIPETLPEQQHHTQAQDRNQEGPLHSDQLSSDNSSITDQQAKSEAHVESPRKNAIEEAELKPSEISEGLNSSTEVQTHDEANGDSEPLVAETTFQDTVTNSQTNETRSDAEERLLAVIAERERQLEVATGMSAEMHNQSLLYEKELAEERQRIRAQEESMRELHTRNAALEKTIAAVGKERDQLRQQLQQRSKEDDEEGEKDEIIAALRQEGEKLSKKQLVLEGTIKTLRAAAKESDITISSLRERVSSVESQNETKGERLRELEAALTRANEMATGMREVADNASKRLEQAERNAFRHEARVAELEATLEKALRDVAEQRKAATAAEERAAGAEERGKVAAKAEMTEELRRRAAVGQEQEASLVQTISQLRASLARAEEQAAWREEEGRRAQSALQLRLQAAEARNEELAAGVPEATRPLLRQIEALHAAHAARLAAANDIEQSLTQRLKEEEARASAAISNERKASMALNEASQRLKVVEGELTVAQTANTRLAAEAEGHRMAADEARRNLSETNVQLAALKVEHERTSQLLQQTEERLRQAREEIRVKEKEVEELQKSHNLEIEKERSLLGVRLREDKTPQSQFRPTHNSGGASPVWKPTGVPSSAATEKLQAALRQREGEIAHLQALLEASDRAKANLEDELVSLTAANESLAKRVEALSGAGAQLEELQARYNTALELMGEKTEQVEELKADLADMKELYRAQISELLTKIEALSSRK